MFLNGGMTVIAPYSTKNRRRDKRNSPLAATDAALTEASCPALDGVAAQPVEKRKTAKAGTSQTRKPISVSSSLPPEGEWVIALTKSYRTVGCYLNGTWRDVVRGTNLDGVVAWLSVTTIKPTRE